MTPPFRGINASTKPGALQSSSSPDEPPPYGPHHVPYGGDYSFDVQSYGAKKPVYARFRNTNGSLSLSVASVGRACGSGVFAHGGNKVVLNVLINGSKVGTVTYAHLTNIPYSSGNVPVGARIGDLATAADGVYSTGPNGCWTGPHVHVEPRNDVRYGCYVGGLFGARVGASTPLGSIGGERATGIRQRCPSNWETSGPTKPAWAASFVDQSAYLNSGLSRSWNLTSVYPGQQGWLKFRVRNTGSKTWSARRARIRSGWGQLRRTIERARCAVTGEWLSAGRPTAMNEASVAPGQIATFVFKVRVPAGSGAIRESFQVVAEGASWLGPVDVARLHPTCVGGVVR